MSLFANIAPALNKGGKMTISVEALDGGKLAVLISPILGAAPESMTPEIEQLRAALSIPLRVTGTAEELDAELMGKLSRYHVSRGDLGSEMDALMKFQEAAKSAKKASQKATKEAPETASEKASESDATVPKPTSMIDPTNPDSMI